MTTAQLAAIPEPAQLPLMLSESQVAQLAGISRQTLTNWRCTRRAGPPFTKLGNKTVRYPRDAFLKWLERDLVTPGAA